MRAYRLWELRVGQERWLGHFQRHVSAYRPAFVSDDPQAWEPLRSLDYAGPEILRGERYFGKEQDVWAFGVVAYVMLVGECPFTTAAEAQDGLQSPFATASIALDERCADGKEKEGEEADGGGALGDAAELVKACLRVDVSARPTFQTILQSRFLNGHGGWGMDP